MPTQEEKIMLDRIDAVLKSIGWAVTSRDTSGEEIKVQAEKPKEGAPTIIGLTMEELRAQAYDDWMCTRGAIGPDIGPFEEWAKAQTRYAPAFKDVAAPTTPWKAPTGAPPRPTTPPDPVVRWAYDEAARKWVQLVSGPVRGMLNENRRFIEQLVDHISDVVAFLGKLNLTPEQDTMLNSVMEGLRRKRAELGMPQ